MGISALSPNSSAWFKRASLIVSYPANTTALLGPKCTVKTLPYILESYQGEEICSFKNRSGPKRLHLPLWVVSSPNRPSQPCLKSPGATVTHLMSSSYQSPASLRAPCLHNKVSAIAAPIRGEVNKKPLHSCGVLQQQASVAIRPFGGWLENAVAGRPVYFNAVDPRRAGVHTSLGLKPQTLQKQS